MIRYGERENKNMDYSELLSECLECVESVHFGFLNRNERCIYLFKDKHQIILETYFPWSSDISSMWIVLKAYSQEEGKKLLEKYSLACEIDPIYENPDNSILIGFKSTIDNVEKIDEQVYKFIYNELT